MKQGGWWRGPGRPCPPPKIYAPPRNSGTILIFYEQKSLALEKVQGFLWEKPHLQKIRGFSGGKSLASEKFFRPPNLKILPPSLLWSFDWRLKNIHDICLVNSYLFAYQVLFFLLQTIPPPLLALAIATFILGIMAEEEDQLISDLVDLDECLWCCQTGCRDSVCPKCGLVSYCSEPHLQNHYGPEGQCLPFRIRYCREKGRYAEAIRTIKPTELIVSDRPLVVGPSRQQQVVCVECLQPVDGSITCEKCHLPLCQPDCAKSSKVRCLIFLLVLLV